MVARSDAEFHMLAALMKMSMMNLHVGASMANQAGAAMPAPSGMARRRHQRHRRAQVVFMRDRPKGSQALVIGIRSLDFFTLIDRTRGGPGISRKPDEHQSDIIRQNFSQTFYPRRLAPVFLVTSAMILLLTASISASVKVFSRGCKVTAMATDFFPSGIFLPS
jgi:hypothetical protein